MKRKMICLLAAVCLLLAGCGANGGGNTTSTKDFPTGQTPAQILTAAAEKTAGATSFVLTHVGEEGITLTATLMKNGKGEYTGLGEISCGCRWFVSGAKRAHLQCQIAQIQQESESAPYTLGQILAELPQLQSGIWERFNAFSVMAEFRGNGSTRYSVEDLHYVDMCYLLDGAYPPGSNGEDDDFQGYFSVTVDGSGYLTELSFKAADLQNPVEHRITVEKLNQKLTIETPWWAES